MYERQFGLRENPFAAGHQSKYVYPSREHQEALAHLRFGIENREPFVLITGEVGTGKTTALYDALSEWKSRAVVALITNSALTRSELYEEICMRFGVPLQGPVSKPQLINQLERPLLVGGGIGIAPLPYLAEQLAGSPPAVLGFRSEEHAEAAALLPGAEVVIDPVLVTDVLPDGYDVLACGPEPMLHAVAVLCPDAQLAWEAPMACGYGACYGCVVEIDEK